MTVKAEFTNELNWMRPSEEYGDVSLSVQASDTHYSTPRVRGLRLDQYTHVEVAVIGPKPKEIYMSIIGRSIKSSLCRPSEIGIDGFDHLFEDGDCPVAGYVSQEDVERLREALRVRMEAKAREAD